MLFIWILHGRKIKNILFILVTAFFAALVAYIQNEEMTVFSTSNGPRALSNVETNKKQITLSFDVGWGDDNLKPMLDYLDDNKIPATIFITGEWAERHAELVEEMKNKGFEIESHGYNHKPYTTLKPYEIKRDISLANTAIEKAGGGKPTYIRPPEGKINQEVIKTVTTTQQQIVLWNINPQDWKLRKAQAIAQEVIQQTTNGSIIRLHGSDSAIQTLKALPIIIGQLKQKGFTFVTLTELISDATLNLENID